MMASMLLVAQGQPLVIDDNVCIPKLLLVKDELYKDFKNRNDLPLDYDFLKETLRNECGVIVVNGESAEKKMAFILSVQSGDVIFDMIDPINGVSQFRITKTGPGTGVGYRFGKEGKFLHGTETILYCPKFHCHPRGAYNCDGDGEETCVYGEGVCTCIRKSLNIAAAITYCYQEYKRKLLETNPSIPSKSNIGTSNKEKMKPYIPNGMMRLYDIKLSDEELKRANKFEMFSKVKSPYASTEKCPHVRRGTMRFNPKTGQKDIFVRGSIIHKDQYKGFASAERINE